LSELRRDAAGQLATEWLLVTAVVVLPVIALIPVMLAMLSSYFNRISEVVSLPFP
jgi:hypothetical protein